jgi:hypothetical protein
MTEQKTWFEKLLKFGSPRSDRRSVKQFAAYRWNGSALQQHSVRNISPTGVYIVTEERWEPGTIVSLTLQREGPLEPSSDRRITTQARVVRCGKDGMGLTFITPAGPEQQKWETLLENLIEQTRPDLTAMVRMAEGLGFLSRVCPLGADEVGDLIRGRLSNHKLANASGIAVKAKKLFESGPANGQRRIKAPLLVRILEDGSCTDEDWLHHFWGGLLATSCTANRNDESNLAFIELFSQLTTFPVRILTVVCTRATKVLSESGSISAKPLACKIEELMLTTGSRGLQTDRDLDRLSELGLIGRRNDNSLTLLPNDETYVTPTSLGLQLFARCNGHQVPQEFYALESRDKLARAK